jgi:exportin-7
MIIFSILFF